MRLAVVIAPLAPDSAAAAFAERLSRAGFRVIEVPVSLALSTEVVRAFHETTDQHSVLVYVGGAVRMDEGHLGLRLSSTADDVFRVEDIGRIALERRPQEAFFLCDLVYEGDDDAFVAAEYADAGVRAVRAREHGFGALVGARAEARGGASGKWEFTRLVLASLDDLDARNERGATPVSRVIERLRAVADGSSRLPSFAHVKGSHDFVLFEPDAEASRVHAASSQTTPPPPSSRSVPPAPVSAPPSSGPPLELLLLSGDDARARGAWDEALDAYKKALMVFGAREGEPRAIVYARIGAVKVGQGKAREAELNYEKALAAFPGHRSSHEALVRIAEEASDWRRVVGYRRKIRAVLGDTSQLILVATLLEEKLGDTRGAVDVLEEARTVSPGDVAVLRRLRSIYERTQRWLKVIDVLGDLCRESDDATERGELRFAQADIALARLRDEARGLALLDGAIEEDPTHDKALSALVAVRSRRNEWELLERLYARLIDRHAERGDSERAWEACKSLGLVRRDHLRNARGALEAFEGALRCKPSDVESRAALADLLMNRGDPERSLAELEQMAIQAPTRVATFRKLFELHTRAGETDRAWLAAAALEELRSADMDHQLLIDQFRPEATAALRPAATIDDEGWDKWLRAPGADGAVAAVLRAVVRAAAASRVDVLRAHKKLFSLSPERKQAPTSTVSIVRTFVWASQILSAPLPELYVYDDVPGGLAAVQNASMSTAIGPGVLTGLPLRELAFVVARHLSYYRPEHYALVFFPTLGEVTTLFLAALSIARPKITATPAAMKLRGEIEKQLSATERENLVAAVMRFDKGGGRVDLASWIRSVELTATRAGLLLAEDLAVAMRVLRRETRAIADISLEERRGDLLAFSASEAFATLRRRLVVAAPPSMRPPSS